MDNPLDRYLGSRVITLAERAELYCLMLSLLENEVGLDLFNDCALRAIECLDKNGATDVGRGSA
jgi:hypothetical protein